MRSGRLPPVPQAMLGVDSALAMKEQATKGWDAITGKAVAILKASLRLAPLRPVAASSSGQLAGSCGAPSTSRPTTTAPLTGRSNGERSGRRSMEARAADRCGERWPRAS